MFNSTQVWNPPKV